MSYSEVPVLVVGGGLSGLSSAAFLALHKVPTLVVERRARTSPFPRTRLIHTRSVECYRHIPGLEQDIRQNLSMLAELTDMARSATLVDDTVFLGPMERWDEGREVSPCEWAPIDQHRLEPLLCDHARRLGAEVEFATELVDLVEKDHGVLAVLRHDGAEREVFAQYVLAADGNRSPLRRRLGVRLTDATTLMHYVSIMCEADLSEPMRGRRAGLWYLDKPTPGTVLLPHEKPGRWVFMIPYSPGDDSAEAFTEKRCVDAIRTAVGVPDLPVTVLADQASGRSVVAGWTIDTGIAEHYRSGRVFFVGDAATLIPPSGGFGANVGIQDAHNLAWKLSAVLSGQATETLLDSYETERRPVAVFTLQEALNRAKARLDEESPDDGAANTLTVVFGHRYRSSAVAHEPDDHGPVAQDPRRITGQPGTRAPHLWVSHANVRRSILDLFGRDWVLLAGPDGKEWISAATTVAAAPEAVSITPYQLGVDLVDVDSVWPTRYGAGNSGATLIRPDGFVAWRNRTGSATAQRDLADVMTRLLGHY